MSIELKIPEVGESVREVQIGRWLKREGDSVAQDENIVELETDKASMELPAPAAGVLGKILKREGDMVAVGDVIGYLEADGKANSQQPAYAKESAATTPKEPEVAPKPAAVSEAEAPKPKKQKPRSDDVA